MLTHIGGYQVLEELGRGGMGVVYRVRGQAGDLALKVLLDSGSHRMQRFEREAQVMQFLGRHPNIITLRGFGEEGGRPFLLMDLLEGEELETYVTRAPQEEAIECLATVARAVHFAHEAGVLHRDLKPANVFVLEDGTPVVMDFGLAKDMQSDEHLTKTGHLVGTLSFMAPEQVQPKGKVLDRTVDVYALGIMLYQVLTGDVPFRGPAISVVARIVQELPTRPSKLTAGVDPHLEATCLRAIAKKPADRFQTAEDLARALERRGAVAKGANRVPLLISAALNVLLFILVLVLAARGPEPAPAPKAEPQPPVTTDASAARTGDTDPPLLQVVVRSSGAVDGSEVSVEIEAEDAGAWVELTVSGPGGAVKEQVPTGQVTTVRVPLREGENQLTFECVDAAGNRSGRVRTKVYRRPIWYTEIPPDRRPDLPQGVRARLEQGEYLNERDDSVLVWVPAGRFRGGAPPKGEWEVRFARGFFMGKYELTWAQYERFCQETKRDPPKPSHESGPKYPVHKVSWEDAIAYCEWAGLRLPSVAEWEYAARGADGRHYPWGNEPPGTDHANIGRTRKDGGPSDPRDGHAQTAPIGSYPKGVSPFGCHDMCGNVSEWVMDGWSGVRRPPPRDGSAKLQADRGLRRARGGSWYSAPTVCRSWKRSNGFKPTRKRSPLGFRVAR